MLHNPESTPCREPDCNETAVSVNGECFEANWKLGDVERSHVPDNEKSDDSVSHAGESADTGRDLTELLFDSVSISLDGGISVDLLNSDAFDLRALSDRLCGKVAIIPSLIDVVREDIAEIVPALESAITASDVDTVREKAHRLKGQLATLGARSASDVALRIEIQAKSGEMTYMQSNLDTLVNELRRFLAATSYRLENETST